MLSNEDTIQCRITLKYFLSATLDIVSLKTAEIILNPDSYICNLPSHFHRTISLNFDTIPSGTLKRKSHFDKKKIIKSSLLFCNQNF